MHYDWDNMPPFLGFDVYFDAEFNNQGFKEKFFQDINIPLVPLLVRGKWGEISDEDLKIPQSKYINEMAEGIVIKNYDKQLFAKIRTDEFKEKAKQTFGISKKYANTDEEKFIATYCTNPRIEKTIHKLIDEGEKLEMELMTKLPKIVYSDIWEEEWNEICFMNWKLDLREVRKGIAKRCVPVLKQIILRKGLGD